MTGQTLALAGATGGAGTTRLTVEAAATLARCGYEVAVLDAAYETQGLRRFVDARPQPDITAVVTDDYDLGAAMHPWSLEAAGSVSVAPASAPFERVARAKTAAAARALEEAIEAAAGRHDVVLVDAPPVAANQAVAAVSAADRVAAVVPDSSRGRDGLALLEGRLRDVGAGLDAVLATPVDGTGGLAEYDARVPDLAAAPRGTPACAAADEAAGGVARAVRPALGMAVDPPSEDAGGLERLLPGN